MRARAALPLLLMVALEVSADYMYRAPPHLLHGPPHGPPPHKHHPYSLGGGKSPGGGPGKLMHSRPPSPYYHRPHHRVRKPPPPPSIGSLSGPNPWKMQPYKTSKEPLTVGVPFRSHGSEPDFGNHVSVLSALKPSTVSIPSLSTPLHSSSLLSYTNIVSDDRGPIHTIPAPNLSLADKPSHIDTSSSSSSSYNSLEQQAIRSALSQLANAKPTVVHHSQGYQVSEPQAHNADLYAPDPDPSRPAPKLQPTTDPHSLPSEGRGPHFSIDPQFGAISSQPGYTTAGAAAGATLSPQDLFHLLNGFPLQQEMQPQLQILHPGLHAADEASIEQQHILLQHQQQHLQQLQQQHLQHQQQQQQLEAESQIHGQYYPQQRQLSHQEFQPQFQSFNYDEQSYQKSLFSGQDHEGSEDAPRPSIQVPPPQQQSAQVTQEVEPVPVTATLPTSSPPQLEDDLPEDYEDVVESSDKYHSTAVAQEETVTPVLEVTEEPPRPVVVREEADSYAADPSLSPFIRQPNSVHVPDTKPSHQARAGAGLPYGARIRPKRVVAP